MLANTSINERFAPPARNAVEPLRKAMRLLGKPTFNIAEEIVLSQQNPVQVRALKM